MAADAKPRSACSRVSIRLVSGLPHGLESLRHGHRVAVVATTRDAITPGGGVPGCFGPLDRRAVGHDCSSRLVDQRTSDDRTYVRLQRRCGESSLRATGPVVEPSASRRDALAARARGWARVYPRP